MNLTQPEFTVQAGGRDVLMVWNVFLVHFLFLLIHLCPFIVTIYQFIWIIPAC